MYHFLKQYPISIL